MILQINERLRVRKDGVALILEEPTKATEVQEEKNWRNIGNYSRWEHVFQGALLKSTAVEETEDIQTFIDALEKAKQEILTAINNANLEG